MGETISARVGMIRVPYGDSLLKSIPCLHGDMQNVGMGDMSSHRFVSLYII